MASISSSLVALPKSLSGPSANQSWSNSIAGKPHPAGFVYPFDTDFSLCRERLNWNVFSACGTILSN